MANEAQVRLDDEMQTTLAKIRAHRISRGKDGSKKASVRYALAMTVRALEL